MMRTTPHGAAIQQPENVPVSQSRRLPDFGGSPPPFVSATPAVSNARLAMLMLIGAETMLFMGLIGAYVMFRFGRVTWPSAQLYLPVAVTWGNTFVLLWSCYTMTRAVQAIRRGSEQYLVKWLSLTGILGTLFLFVQGYEWTQLIQDGLTISTGIYGATFYVLIGCHALHVLAAVIWLLAVLWLARRGYFSQQKSIGVEICGMYWYFVGALWVVLFGLVYLN
jgi:heme/copper-type cytochrome/quinol oxidase subunit 3